VRARDLLSLEELHQILKFLLFRPQSARDDLIFLFRIEKFLIDCGDKAPRKVSTAVKKSVNV
jgi:hypothetical protein